MERRKTMKTTGWTVVLAVAVAVLPGVAAAGDHHAAWSRFWGGRMDHLSSYAGGRACSGRYPAYRYAGGRACSGRYPAYYPYYGGYPYSGYPCYRSGWWQDLIPFAISIPQIFVDTPRVTVQTPPIAVYDRQVQIQGPPVVVLREQQPAPQPQVIILEVRQPPAQPQVREEQEEEEPPPTPSTVSSAPASRPAPAATAAVPPAPAPRPMLRPVVPLPRPMLPSPKELRLLRRLQQSPNKEDREDAAEDLEDFRTPRVIAALQMALLNDPEKDVREQCAKTLGKFGQLGAQTCLPALRAAEQTDRDRSVRKAAAKAIERLLAAN